MKHFLHDFRAIPIALAILLSIGQAYAQTVFTWTGGGGNNNWNNAANWSKGPGISTSTWPNQNASQNDQALINSGTPAINASFTNTSLTLVTVNAPASLNLTANNTFTITGNFVGNGTFIQSNGTVNVSGDVTITTFNITGGTFAYTGSGTQSVKGATYDNFTKSGAGTATLAGSVSCIGNIVLSAGNLDIGANNLSGQDLSGAGTLTFGGGTVTLSDDNTHTGTNSGSPINYTYDGVGTQTVRGLTFSNLTFSGAGLKDFSSGATVTGTFSTASNIDQSSFAFVFQGPVVWTAGAVTAGGNAVTYNSASNQDVIPNSGTNFTTFTKGGTGTAILRGNTNATATTVSGGTLDLNGFNFSITTLTGAGTIEAGSGTFTINGNNTHTGTFNAGTGTVLYNVNAAQTFPGYSATGYYNLTVSNGNNKTLTSALTVANRFLYNGSGTLAFGNNNLTFNHFSQTNGTITFGTGTVGISGNFHKTAGTYTNGSGTVNFSGTGFVRSDAGIAFSSGTTNVAGTRTIQSAGTVTAGTLAISGTLNNKTILVVNTAMSGVGDYTQDSVARLDVNFTGAGPTITTFNVNAVGTTVRYIAAGNQTTRAETYRNLTFTGSGTKTISSGTSIDNVLNVSAPTVCAFDLTVPSTLSGTGLLTMTAPAGLTVNGNFTNTGGLTMNGILDLNGDVNHGGGNLNLNASTVTIAGTLNGTGNVTFSGAGSINFEGGSGWTSTTGTFTPGNSTVTYSGTSGAQTVRSAPYHNLSLTGAATKTLGTGANGAVANVFNLPSGQTLEYPTSAATLALNGSITGTGQILGDPTGTLTIGSAGAVTTSLGTIYFDTTKAMGTINFNRQWNRAIQVRIGSSVRMNNYTFLGGFVVGGVEVADGEVFKVESPIVTPASTLAANVGRLRYIMLGTGSKFVFEPGGTIPAGTNLTFPIGPLPTASSPYQVLQGNANGTLNAATIGATTLNGTGTNFDDQILVGYNLFLEDGSLVGTISSYVSATQITLAAPGALINVPAASRFRLIQAYRPVTIIPSAAVSGGSIEVSVNNHAGGGITSGSNVPNVPSNRRTNFIYNVRATGGFPNYGIWTEALLSNDFNATIDDAKYSFFRWNGAFWIKLAADLVGPGGVPTNTQIRRNTVTGVAGVQSYILGQTGGVLPDDPTFSWTGGGGNNNWKQAGNWNVFPAGAGNWPDDIGHNVIIDGSGIGGPIIQSGDSINVRHIFHSAKNLTIQNNGILNIVGNYSYNQPNLTAAGIGRLIQSGFTITGTNGSQFTTQLNRGSLLFTTEGGFIGAVQSIASNSSLTLASIGGSTPVNIPDSSTYNIIVPTISAGAGNLTSSNTSRVVTGTGFTSSLNGRAIYLAGNNLIGFVSIVQSPTSLLLVSNAAVNATNQAYFVSSAIVPGGTATTNFQTGSKVRYNNSTQDQTIAATSYSQLDMLDNRSGATTELNRYVNCPGQTITIRNQYRGRPLVKVAASLGCTWQFQHNSRMTMYVPVNSNTGLGGVFNNFPVAGLAGVYNVKWGNSAADRIHYDAYSDHTNNWDFPTMEAQIENRFGDVSFTAGTANARWVFFPGYNITVNGSFFANNITGGTNRTIRFGTNTANPPVNLTLLGNITGLNQIQNNGSPIHQGNITIAGSGTVSGNLFVAVNQLRNLTINRPGAVIQLSAAENLTVTEKITVSNGTFGHTGSGTITVGSAAASGIDVTGGTFSMSGSSNLSVISTGNFTQTGGTTNLSNSGTVSILGNFSQSGGSFARTNLAASIQRNVSITGGNTDFSGSTITLNGTGAQNLTGSANGFAFHNLTIDKTSGNVNITGGKVKITGTVNMPVTNTANLVTGVGNLTLVSAASGTGRIGSVLGGALSGSNFTTQRFVNGGVQGWYFLGTPVSSQNLGNWGDNFEITTPNVCSGTFTNADLNRNTVFQMAETAVPANGTQPVEANGWRALSSCAIDRGKGYRVFLKNNFFLAGGTFDNTGTLASGPFPFTVTHTPGSYDNGGWNLVANPYPSNINWDAPTGWTKTNMQNAIYIWNSTTNSYGSYIAGSSVNGVDNIIPSGQAFFVRANPSPVLQINENAKTATVKNLLRTAEDRAELKIIAEGLGQKDESNIYFHEMATDLFDDQGDAVKMQNPGLNLLSLDNNLQSYSIQGLPMIQNQKVIPLGIKAIGSGAYSFSFKGISTLQGLTLMLKDNYLGQVTEVSDQMTVSFQINADEASSGNGRFELIFTNPESVTRIPTLKKEVFQLYPNPSKGTSVVLETGEKSGKIRVTDLLGKVVFTKQYSSGAEKITLESPTLSGVYQVSFESANGQLRTLRWVVR
jgi:fibronectin-binding autotransporter adhesin